MFESLFDECIDVINDWKPKQKYPKETDYRNDLMNFLLDELEEQSSGIDFGAPENIKVTKEDGRGLCDIAVGHKQVGIELKKDLKSKSQMNRLQGQMDDYEDDYEEGVIVVLVGDVSKGVVSELRYKLQRKLDSGGMAEQFRIKLINKSSSAKSREEPKEQKQDFGLGLDMPESFF